MDHMYFAPYVPPIKRAPVLLQVSRKHLSFSHFIIFEITEKGGGQYISGQVVNATATKWYQRGRHLFKFTFGTEHVPR